ncbi:recombinase RecT [Thalassobacter stenotrophicus]|uniref:P33 n=2 Tax=Thalassobacter stenotrophicus TaxID=266809 RepID=A0A0P1EYS5_9RHOB|nr:recombinase RecT [Thalassobacter stenotrophicus]CUH60270.1 hypothetical protein THS5294_01559 [Thalassobacter stenotrophicus]SHI71600.1 recombination protein RecT [Thalassobacter stenotrophicus DSM 16310]
MSTAIEKVKTKPLTQVTNVKELLWNDAAKAQLQQVAAAHMKPERMMRLMANAMRTTPKLAECDPMSLLGGLMTCAGLGLEPNTIMGHAYLIPFKNNRKKITEVQLVVGYKGLIDLARRSGHISSISANIHYSDDEVWEYEEGTEARLRHVPGAQEGDKLHAYAIAKFRDGGHAYVVLPWAKVTKIRNGSQGWQTAVKYGTTERNPWSTHEDEMAKKTAIRALSKYLPLSVEFRDAVTVDGGQADFASFAMNPSEALDAVPGDQDGEMIEAEAVQTAEDESGSQSDHEQTEQTPNEDAKPAKTRAAEAKPAKSEAIPQKKEEGAPDPADEAAAGLVARIVGDLVDCEDADAVDAVMALWEDQIATLSNAAKAQVNKAANSATNGGVNS